MSTNRVSGGAGAGTPTCPTCPHLLPDKNYPGWGWCDHMQNRAPARGWISGFRPSQSPTGSCELHPERIAHATQPAGSSDVPVS